MYGGEETKEEIALDTTYTDAGGNKWTVKLPLPLVDEFCDEQGIKLGGFSPESLTNSQMLTLAYRGTRWMTQAKNYPMNRAEFLSRLCDDDGNPTPAYTGALTAAMNAVVNFILRSTVPPEKMSAAMNIVRTVRDEELSKDRGAAETR